VWAYSSQLEYGYKRALILDIGTRKFQCLVKVGKDTSKPEFVLNVTFAVLTLYHNFLFEFVPYSLLFYPTQHCTQ
jgi:hypothetical protein